MTRRVDSVELALWERIMDVGLLLERYADRVIRQNSTLKFSQYEILVRLRNAGGELRMADLASKLMTAPSSLTYQISTLERDGLVARATAPSDERGVLASITPAGRQQILDLEAITNDMVLEGAIVPLDRSEIEMASAVLGKLQIHLRGEATGGVLPEDAPGAPPRATGAQRPVQL